MNLSIPALTRFLIREATVEDQHELASLFHFESYVHRHLDWRTPLDWINHPPFLVAEQKGRLIGALASPVDTPGIAWIQVFAVRSNSRLDAVWSALWKQTLSFHKEYSTRQIAAIPSQPWFGKLLTDSHFTHSHDVVTLIWEGQPLTPPKETADVAIREMHTADLKGVLVVDQESFEPLWQQSEAALLIALKQACIATVAEKAGRIIGYQISTCGHLGGHLARLAVVPDQRGRHIGEALVFDLLSKFIDRSVNRVTVNTQHHNTVSLRLYEKLGFRRTGETFHVFTFTP